MSNRIGMDQSIGVIVTVVIVLAIVLSLFFMVNDSVREFFKNADDSSTDTSDSLTCDAKCFKCCMETPDECGTDETDDLELALCNCKC